MTRTRTLMLLAGGLVAALAGCGADVPENPSWVADVHPIMVAWCIRCHNANGTMDPVSLPGTIVPGNFDHATVDDLGVDRGVILQVGTWTADGMMPPPPAAKLEDWQIETLKRWVAEDPLL